MDFRNKYLKYKPEITFDIFQKVWDKLIENGYIPIGKYDVERGFGDFKTLYCYLRTTETQPMIFNCYSVIPALFWVETTVQEILGYDPFVSDDDFVLPEKWYVEVTPENKSTLNDWKVKQEYSMSLYSYDYKFISENGGGHHREDSIKDAVKITFDQFKKYVLKQGVEESKEVIPEYVEALIDVSGYFIKGNIYKVESSQDIKSCRLISNIKSGSHSAGTILLVDLSNNNRFKPSSKSAFDAQNQPKTIEKWSVGSYVVFLNSEIQSNGFNKGEIQQIREYNSLSITYYSGAGNTVSDKGISEQIKWFATKSEAEKFAKTLVEPLKQAVLCETQEQWDFVTEKLGYKWTDADWTDYGNNTCVNLEYKGFGTADVAYIGYQILSFSDWCAQSNYEFLSTEDKYKEVLRKNARTLGGEVVEMNLADYDALLKNMFDFNVSEQTANNLSETIDRVRYRAMQKAQTETLDEMFCASVDEVFKSLDNYTNKNKIQISTDNEIKINIIQKQSIKI